MGQIMDISKKYTKLVSTKISTLQKGKMKDTTFLGTFSTIWEFSCFRSEKSIEKINIHNVKIWTFRTSSSWENMTHETHMQLYSRQRTIFFAASVMTNVSSMSTYNTYILFLKCMGKKRNQREFIPPLFSMTLSKKKWRYEYLHKEEF